MKKAGSSNSKSKIRPTSKSSDLTERSAPPDPGSFALAAQDLAVGHRPPATLKPQDAALFRAFQSNLLSLVSHELRTPLAGILNALSVLDMEGDGLKPDQTEWVRMAYQNAQRLNQALSALLDLAAIESGTFHFRLKEVDLVRSTQGQVEAHRTLFHQYNLRCEWDANTELNIPAVLADPQKLNRALSLCFQSLVSRAEAGSSVKVQVAQNCIHLKFLLEKSREVRWETAWSQSLVGLQGGVSSPFSAFSGVAQSEEAFLTRDEEGLGSEFLLIHEILRVHRGKFTMSRKGRSVTLSLHFPELSTDEGLQAVLSSRAFQVSTELGSIGLILIQVPEKETVKDFIEEVRKSLFRMTDAAYPLPDKQQIALILDDCRVEEAAKLMDRLEVSLARSEKLAFGTAHCPTDGLDPSVLLELAGLRLESRKTGKSVISSG